MTQNQVYINANTLSSDINTQMNLSSSVTVEPSIINTNSNPSTIISGTKKKDPIYVCLNANNVTDYLITSNAVKLIPKIENVKGYIKLYTEINSNLKIDDRIFLMYDPLTTTGNTSLILDSYLLYTGFTSIVNYVKSTHGYRVIDLDNKNNAVIIEKKYMNDYDGKTLDGHYIAKTYIKNIKVNAGSIDGAVIKYCDLNYDNNSTVDIEILQSVILSGRSWYLYYNEKYDNRYLGLRNKYSVDSDVNEYNIDTYITKDNESYGYTYTYNLPISGSTIENGNFYNCTFTGCTIYYGYYENCKLHNTTIINGYFKNSVVDSNCNWTGGTWYEDLYTGYTYSGMTGFGPSEWNAGTWNLGNFVNKRNVSGIGGWITGIFNSGRFINSDWIYGVFNNGEIKSSEWLDGIFNGGSINNSIWYTGTFNNGLFSGGQWIDGIFYFGIMEFTNWNGGKLYNGELYRVMWSGGDFYDGLFYGGGSINTGLIYGGQILDASGVYNCTIYDSTITNCEEMSDVTFMNGIIQDSSITLDGATLRFLGGKLKNITFTYVSDPNYIFIDGCIIDGLTINESGTNPYISISNSTISNLVNQATTDWLNITIENSELNSGSFGYKSSPDYYGKWLSGNWYYGTFFGVWSGGTFYNGFFKGKWLGGYWISGSFQGISSVSEPFIKAEMSVNYTTYTKNSTIGNSSSTGIGISKTI